MTVMKNIELQKEFEERLFLIYYDLNKGQGLNQAPLDKADKEKDFIVNDVSYEVKNYSNRLNADIFIEIESRGKASGIVTTKADKHLLIGLTKVNEKPELYFTQVDTQNLKDLFYTMVRTGLVELIRAGDLWTDPKLGPNTKSSVGAYLPLDSVLALSEHKQTLELFSPTKKQVEELMKIYYKNLYI